MKTIPPTLHAEARFARALACLLVAWLFACWAPAASAQTSGVLGSSPETAKPVYASQATDIAPLVMLVMARDHSLFYPAYNDWSDLDGDGAIDKSFNNDIEYVGLFNSYLCYVNKNYTKPGWWTSDSTNKNPDFYFGLGYYSGDRFNNAGIKVPGELCDYNDISGNFLNWATTSRMDAIRVALYGGERSTDSANGVTKLRRAYIPDDGHAWSKVYKDFYTNMANLSWNSTVWGYPNYFGNSNAKPESWGCVFISECKNLLPSLLYTGPSGSGGYHPLDPLEGGFTVPPVFSALNYNHVSAVKEKYVVVESCVAPYISGCTAYYNQDGTLNGYKPTGILQDYGATGKIKFGLISGSYDSNLSGGILRKNITNFDGEINPNSGQFTKNNASIIKQINNFSIRNFNNGEAFYYNPPNYIYLNRWNYTKEILKEGYYNDWGNPIAEMMYESLRYFKGPVSGRFSPVFDGQYSPPSEVEAGDSQIGLATPSWQDAYSQGNVCAKPNLLVISGPNSFDSDELPGAHQAFIGSPFNNRQQTNRSGSLANVNGTVLNVTTLANDIGSTEGINGSTKFIGHVAGVATDYAPTAKSGVKLGEIRGLAPDGANSDGSYYAASVAAFGKSAPLRSIGGINMPTVDTYSLQFAHDAPAINIPINGKTISIIPFAKTLDVNTPANNAKGIFQPTNQILGAYIRTLNDPKNANGQFYLEMDVNFNDSSWGGSHAMGVVSRYTIWVNSNRIYIKVITIRNDTGKYGGYRSPYDYNISWLNGPYYFSTGAVIARQNVGYIISGSTADGVYLVATDASSSEAKLPYFLNVPATNSANYCSTNVNAVGCDNPAPFNSTSATQSFSVSQNPSNYLLKDPLWYAAKWGGYVDGVPPTGPTTGNPDNFVDLTNPANLKTALPKILDKILDVQHFTQGSVSNNQQAQGAEKIFATSFDLGTFGGVLTATPYAVSAGASIETVNYSAGWSTSSTLLNEVGRSVYFRNPIDSTLSSFSFANLEEHYPGKFGSDPLVQYLRGRVSNEVRNGGAYRNRSKILGMTVNSVPVYSADTGAVYVAANDGMLHAFNASNGAEKFAYVPTTAINSANNLSLLASPAYVHRYFLDGNIAVSNKADTGGVNYLVGFMGRAAKGLFGLRVTAAGVNASAGTWENFGVGDNDMGYLLGQPVITKLSDNTPVVVFGNGYNSSNHMAVLYVARLSDGVVLAKFSSNSGSAAAPNGLATPGLVTNSNAQVQYAYAGDYLGNVWKFNLSTLTNAVTASPPAASRVFTTADPSNKVQPITVAITPSNSSTSADAAVANKQFLFFGTGSDLTSSDIGSFQTQSMYGLIDDGAGTSLSKANLVQRTIDGTGTAAGRVVRSFNQPSTVPANDMTNKSGWYMNWSASGTSASEKVFSAAVVREGAVPPLMVSSNIVNRSSCISINSGYLNVMDAFHGGGLSESYLDLNRNRSFADETFNSNGAKVISSIDFAIGVLGQASFSGSNVLVHGSAVNATTGIDKADAATKKLNARTLRRISWREIVK